MSWIVKDDIPPKPAPQVAPETANEVAPEVAMKKSIIALNYAAMAQHGIILLLVGPMVPSLMRTFAIGESITGLLLGMGSLGFVAGPLFAGAIIDRINARAALVAGLVIEVGVLVLFGLAPAFVVAIAANFGMHFGSSFVETSANVLPTLATNGRKPHAVMNLVHMFFSVGAFIGPLLIGIYIESTGAWRPIPLFAVIPTGILLTWALFVRFPKKSAGEQPASTSPEVRRRGRGPNAARSTARQLSALGRLLLVLKRRYVLLGSISLLLYVGAEVGVSSWVVYYLERRLLLSPAMASGGLSILWVCIMIGRYANSRLGERLSSRLLVAVSGFAGAVGVVAFLFAESVASAYLCLGWIGLCLSGVFPNIMGELNAGDPERAGTITAVMAMGAALGAGLFQWFVGFLAENAGLTAAFVVPAVLQILLVVTFLPAVRDRDRRFTAASEGPQPPQMPGPHGPGDADGQDNTSQKREE